jgi:hypothetical protein
MRPASAMIDSDTMVGRADFLSSGRRIWVKHISLMNTDSCQGYLSLAEKTQSCQGQTEKPVYGRVTVALAPLHVAFNGTQDSELETTSGGFCVVTQPVGLLHVYYSMSPKRICTWYCPCNALQTALFQEWDRLNSSITYGAHPNLQIPCVYHLLGGTKRRRRLVTYRLRRFLDSKGLDAPFKIRFDLLTRNH